MLAPRTWSRANIRSGTSGELARDSTREEQSEQGGGRREQPDGLEPAPTRRRRP